MDINFFEKFIRMENFKLVSNGKEGNNGMIEKLIVLKIFFLCMGIKFDFYEFYGLK